MSTDLTIPSKLECIAVAEHFERAAHTAELLEKADIAGVCWGRARLWREIGQLPTVEARSTAVLEMIGPTHLHVLNGAIQVIGD